MKLKKITLPGGRKITVRVGTHIIDRCWRFVKERLSVNQNVKTGYSGAGEVSPMGILASRPRPLDIHGRPPDMVHG